MDTHRPYSPTLPWPLVRSLYRARQATGVPIATYVRRVVRRALTLLNARQGLKVCRACMAEDLDEEGRTCRDCVFRASRKRIDAIPALGSHTKGGAP